MDQLPVKTDKPMTPAEAADVLQAHNEWRRGADTDMVSPGVLGLAIDCAVGQLRATGHVRVCDDVIPQGCTIKYDPALNRLSILTADGRELAHAQPFLVAPT